MTVADMPKCLTVRTKLYVVGKDGVSEMSLYGLCNAVNGGMKLEDVEITLDEEHSKHLQRKFRAIEYVASLMKNMDPGQAEQVVAICQNNEDLMTLTEDYQ